MIRNLNDVSRERKIGETQMSFTKAITVKQFLSLKIKPTNLYVKVGCSMEVCEGTIEIKNGFAEVRDVGRAGGEPSGIWWVGTKNAGGLGLCVHENRFLYKKEKSNNSLNPTTKEPE